PPQGRASGQTRRAASRRLQGIPEPMGAAPIPARRRSAGPANVLIRLPDGTMRRVGATAPPGDRLGTAMEKWWRKEMAVADWVMRDAARLDNAHRGVLGAAAGLGPAWTVDAPAIGDTLVQRATHDVLALESSLGIAGEAFRAAQAPFGVSSALAKAAADLAASSAAMTAGVGIAGF